MTQLVYIYPTRRFGGLEIEAVVSEDHQSQMEVTKNPVERDADSSDHASLMPQVVTISAGFSDFPFNNTLLLGSNTAFRRIQTAWEELRKLQTKKQRVDVQTGLKLYRNMMLTNLSTSQDANTANILLFSATFEEILITNTQQLAYPASKFTDKTTQNRTASTTPRGTVDAPPVDSNQPRNKSLLKRVFG